MSDELYTLGRTGKTLWLVYLGVCTIAGIGLLMALFGVIGR